MSERYVEYRKRGVLGWITLLIFLGWNALMISWLFSAGSSTHQAMQTATSEAEAAGAAIGTGIGFVFILVIWTLGAVITGLFALIFRGRKTIVVRR